MELLTEVTFSFSSPTVVEPGESFVHEGVLGARFTCAGAPFGSTNYTWIINGVPFDSLTLTDVSEVIFGGQSLEFRDVPPEYNGTIVQCTVLLRTNSTQTSSNNGTLLVQGNVNQCGS